MTNTRRLERSHVVAKSSARAWMHLLVLLLALLPSLLLHAQTAAPLALESAGAAIDPLHNLPLLFRDAADPLNPGLIYRADGAKGRVGFSRNGVSLAFRRGGEEMVVGVEFEGKEHNANLVATEAPRGAPPVYTFTSAQNDATTLRHYSDVIYRGVYDGIDIRYYGVDGALKYDCLLAPGADPSLVRMRYSGVRRLEIDEEGDLEIFTPWGRITERRPYVYQKIDGIEKPIAASFRLIDETSFGFRITGEYDRAYPLVIDPMILSWSTFVGGGGDGYINDLVLDGDGNIYATGWYNQGFPTTPGVYSEQYNQGPRDCYIFKLSSDGERLLFSTYVGGSEDDAGSAIRLGPDSTIYVGGQTESADFPTTPGAFARDHSRSYDCFLLKLSRTGDRLLYSTFLGGDGVDTLSRIHVGPDGAVTATGTTNSMSFPTTPGAYDGSLAFNGAAADLFVTRLAPDGSALLFSTYIGGSFTDLGADLAVDSDGETVVTGLTISSDFPTTAGAYDRTQDGSFTEDAFLLRLSANGRELRYSTLLGGSGDDGGNAVAIAPGGRVIVAGFAGSDFPVTTGAFDRQHNFRKDGFVAILENNGSRLVAASYLGSGNSDDELQAIALDDDGSIFVAGKTLSVDAITPVCPVGVSERGRANTWDVYVARISADLGSLLFADYLGGGRNDYGTRISLGRDRCSRELTIGLTSHSTDFPTTPRAFQPTKLNTDDDQPVVLRIRPTIVPAFSSEINCTSVSFRDNTSGACVWGDTAWRPTTWRWDFGDGSSSTEQNPEHRYRQGGDYRVVLHVGCPRDSFVSMISISDSDPMLAHMDTSGVVAPGDTIGVPMMLDDVGDRGAITSLRIALHYDYSTVRPVNISTSAGDSLFHGSLIAGWAMTIETEIPGRFVARFDAPSAAAAVTGPGLLLYPRFWTYIRPNPKPTAPWSDTTTVSFDVSAGDDPCGQAITEPGLVRLEMCGFSTRLIERTSSKYALDVGAPNPFAESIEIRYSLGLDGPTVVTVHDLLGNHIVTLLDQHLDAGTYSTLWNTAGIPTGTYYIRLHSGDWSATTRAVKQ